MAVSVSLKRIIDEFKLEVITSYTDLDDVVIQVADATRPGLQLTGFFDHFGANRLQLIGNMEMAYLEQCEPKERLVRLSNLFARGIPALIVSRDLEVGTEMLVASKRYSVPILRTSQATSDFISALIKFLNLELAPHTTLHGVLVEIYGEGILILGESGVGKSETAMEIVKRGHRLIADDLVEVRRVSDTTLVGQAPEMIRHLIEIRGLGIMDVKELYGVSSVKMQDSINFVINLELWDENKVYERLGTQEEYTDILGIKVPSITIPVRPGRNLAIIAEVAAINFRQKQMGYNAAEALLERLFGNTEDKTVLI